MKLLQLFITLFYFVFSSSIQTNGLIFTSAQDHSYISATAQFSSSSSHFADRNPDPLFIPKSYISSAPSTAPNLSNSNDVNFKALEVQIATSNRDAHLAVKISENILKNPSTTIKIRKCLGQCIENFNTIIDDLTKATNDVHAKDIYMAKEDLSSIKDDISACQTCFQNMVGGQSPLKPYEDSISNTADSCLAILSQTK
ncbi:PMEI domain-containing protein [Heracleum sosnowskyi]|uniref:PMEI domain-containing protein n=1 Tax=Heracleum sosnowskyi TaxID=360622 RepID=A0AAD8J6I6_9APIA|nr:PMEI domain-containing protein [Heracleum sosnowskyi]